MPEYKGPPPLNAKLLQSVPISGTAVAGVVESVTDSYSDVFPLFGDDDVVYDSAPLLPTDAAERKKVRIGDVVDMFPAALAEIGKVLVSGNMQHYGSADTLKWEQAKSSDHPNCIQRHYIERGSMDTDGCRHTAKLACRALMLLQIELQNEGAPKPRNAL